MARNRTARSNILSGLLFAAPALLGFLILNLIPMIYSLFLSFTNFSGFNSPSFVGLANFKKMFNGDDVFFYKSLLATGYYTLLNVPATIIFSFAISLLLNSKIKGRGFFRSLFYLPTIVPVVASSMIWLWILNPTNGILNQLLDFLHLPTGQWLYSESTVIPTIVMIGLWTAGGTMLIFLAGLQGIPQSYYEAIDIDGGNYFHKLINVTLPLMTPTIFFNAIMAIIGSFQVFTQAYILTQGGPNNSSLFFAYLIYREAFQNANMGYASALAWILFVIILFFSYVVLKTQNKWVYYEGE